SAAGSLDGGMVSPLRPDNRRAAGSIRVLGVCSPPMSDRRPGTNRLTPHWPIAAKGSPMTQAEITNLTALREAEGDCTRCPLYRNATQVVPGEGPGRAKVMFVGEQPGNDEDLAGRPFVGPAGRLLDRAIEEAGLDRATIFVTNAVKHFKFEPRGKRRLHKKPNAYEIDRCRWWLDHERAI